MDDTLTAVHEIDLQANVILGHVALIRNTDVPLYENQLRLDIIVTRAREIVRVADRAARRLKIEVDKTYPVNAGSN